MEKELKIRISVDKNTGAISVVDGEFTKLSGTVKKTADATDSFGTNLKNLAAGGVIVYAIKQAFDAVFSSGFKFNSQMEDSIAGLAALTVATSSNISAMGNQLSITEKYNLAQVESAKTAQQLNAINAETPHSLAETTQIYKSLYVGMKNVGASNEQMIHLTKQLSIASGSAGIELNSLLSGVDGLATGTVEVASDFGRFLGSLGLTNEALKGTKDVVGLLESKLGEFKVLDTMTVAVSNFDNAWSQIAGELTKDIFSSAKDDINAFTVVLNTLNGRLTDYKANIEDIRDVHKLSTVDDAVRELTQLVAKYDDLKKSGVGLFESTQNYNAEVKKEEFLISSLTQKIERLQTTKDTLKKKEAEPDKWMTDGFAGYDKDKLTNEIAATKEADKERIKSAKERNEAINALDAMSFEIYNKYENDKLKKAKDTLDAENALAAMGSEIFKKYEEEKKALTLENIDTSMNHMQSMLDMQISLAESAKDWTNNLSGQAGNIADISKAMDAMRVLDMKGTKTSLQLQEDYAKAFLSANGDIVKEKEAGVRFDEGNAQLKDELNRQEINGYATLAGAMSQSFSKGSDAAIAFMAIQQSLSLYNGVTAVLGAWASAPFHANLPAVASTTVAVAALLAQVGQSLSGGGSGGSSAPTEDFAANKTLIEANYNPITDRLDRQISLLESIDRKGSSSSLGVNKAGTDFEKNYKLWVEDTLQKARIGSVNSKMSVTELNQIVDAIEAKSGVNTFTTTPLNGLTDGRTGYISLNTDILREGYNLISALQVAQGGYTGTLGQAGMHGTQAEMNAQVQSSIASSLNEAQNLVNDWALGIVASMDDLKSAAKDFKGYYDDVTGSMFYQTDTLKNAFDDVDKLRGTATFADYLKTQITDIQSLQTFFTNETFTLLSSTDANDIQAQINKVAELGVKTGQTFTGGAEEALNYLESIGLVAKAMADSRQNIQTWGDSFKTPTELAQDMATTLGTTLATSMEELKAMGVKLSGGLGGLTNEELTLLNANRALIGTFEDLATATNAANAAKLTELNSISESWRTAGQTQLQNLEEMAQKLGLGIYDSVETVRNVIEEQIGNLSGMESGNQAYVASLTASNAADIANYEKLIADIEKGGGGIHSAIFSAYNRNLITGTELNATDAAAIAITRLNEAIAKISETELPAIPDTVQLAKDLEAFGNANIAYIQSQASAATSVVSAVDTVTAAIDNTVANLKTWGDSLYTSDQLQEQAFGTFKTNSKDLATWVTEMSKSIADGADGFTDAELAYATANAAFIQSRKDSVQSYILNQYDSLNSLSQAFASSTDSMQTFRDDLLNVPLAFNSIMSGISSITSAEDANNLLSGLQTYYSQETDLLTTAYADKIKLIEEQSSIDKEALSTKISLLEDEKNILRDFKDFADGIRISQLQDSFATSALFAKFDTSWSDMSAAVLHGDANAADLATRTQDYATNYLDALKGNSSKSDYTFEQNKIASLFEGFKGTNETATLDTLNLSLENMDGNLEDAIKSLEDEQKTALDSLKNKTLDALKTLESATRAIAPDLNASFDALEATAISYLDVSSPIVSWLKTLDASVNNINFDAFQAAANTSFIVPATPVASVPTATTPTTPILNTGLTWVAGARYQTNEGSTISAATPEMLASFVAMGLINGSHANGLSRVPFDGYIAELHKDEEVLTAEEAQSRKQPIFINTQDNLLEKVLKEITALKNTIADLQAKNNTSTNQIVRNTRKPLLEYPGA